MNAGAPQVGSLEVQRHRLHVARERATMRLAAGRLDELLELCAINGTGLKAFAQEASAAAAELEASGTALYVFGFVTALELLVETWAEREELPGVSDAG